MEYRIENNVLNVFLNGKLDSAEAKTIGSEVDELLRGSEVTLMVFDAEKLTHISADGLRMLLCFHNGRYPKLRVINVSPAVYECFDAVKMTKLLDIRKKRPEITVNEQMHIGSGTTAEVYRLDDERIVKVYHPGQDPEWIEAQRNNSQQLLLHGIPGAVAYDIVTVGDSVGVIYELLEAESLGAFLGRNTDRLEEYAQKLASQLRQIHQTKFDKNLLVDTLDYVTGQYHADEIKRYTDKDIVGFLDLLTNGGTLVHGDFHPMNIMMKNSELVLIDTGDAFFRYGILDLVTLYTYLIIQADTPEKAMNLTGMTPENAHKLWHDFVKYYFSPQTEEEKNSIEMTIRHVAILRMVMALALTDEVGEAVKSAMIPQILADTPSDLNAFKEEIDAFEAKYIS